MYIAIINLTDSSCAYTYQDDTPNQSKFGGPWGWESSTVHVQISDDLVATVKDASGFVIASSVKGQQDDQGNWSVVANS